MSSKSSKKPQKKRQKKEEEKAVDLGFSFGERSADGGRTRIITVTSDNPPKVVRNSITYQKLHRDGQRDDFSYNDLRDIMEEVFTKKPNLKPVDFNKAFQTGVKNFDPDHSDITLDTKLDIDLQLLVHHLLKFQYHNRGPTLVQADRVKENPVRQLELEKSKKFLSTDPFSQRDKLIPPKADKDSDGTLRDAMPALSDLNRPLEHSIFANKTYSAVYKIMYDILIDAYDRAKSDKKYARSSKMIAGQRAHFNEAYFDALEKMDPTVIEEGDGKSYVKKHIPVNFDSDYDTFDEGSASSSDESDSMVSDPEISSKKDKLKKADEKRRTILGATGVFSKLQAQKELIDGRDQQGKHDKIRRKTDRFVTRLDRKYNERFKSVENELKYLKDKSERLDKEIEKISQMIKDKPKSKGKETYTQKQLQEALGRAKGLKKELLDFYSKLTMGKLEELGPGWKRKRHQLISRLGEKGMKDYIWSGERPKIGKTKPRLPKEQAAKRPREESSDDESSEDESDEFADDESSEDESDDSSDASSKMDS